MVPWQERIEHAAARFQWEELAIEALLRRARQARLAGELMKAIGGFAEVERRAAALGSRRLVAEATAEIGVSRTALGDLESGRAALETALAAYEALGDLDGCARVAIGLGDAALKLGRRKEAVSRYQRSEQLYARAGDRYGMASALNHQGEARRQAGEIDAAEELYRRARGLLRGIGSEAWVFPDFNLGLIRLIRGQPREARPNPRARDAHVHGPEQPRRAGRRAPRPRRVRRHRGAVAAVGRAPRRGGRAGTEYAEPDTARLAAFAAEHAAANAEWARAVHAFGIARGHWAALRNAGEVERIDRRIATLALEEK